MPAKRVENDVTILGNWPMGHAPKRSLHRHCRPITNASVSRCSQAIAIVFDRKSSQDRRVSVRRSADKGANSTLRMVDR